MKPWASQLRRVAGVIRRGGVVAYPTASCYGLGCDPRNRRAVRRILRLKNRPVWKGLIVIGASRRQLLPYADRHRLPGDIDQTMDAVWPGPVSLILPAGRRCPPWVRGRHDGIALREDAHPPARDLCKVAGMAIVSTSANPAGFQSARTATEVRRYFGSRVDAILRAPIGKQRKPSRIIDVQSGRTLRPG
ncbi:L-threonylcarbamoyladenylate synthase [Thermithiobacillus plumbiphilus]|uniref:L-threonylcarbamoyladenylate synthase n=1 Tax=Thermithiobacillus plumbiphilus TaxID=1729899 RepID=A0ABU9D660_9PROT